MGAPLSRFHGTQASPLRQFVALTATSPKGRGLGMAAKLPIQLQSFQFRQRLPLKRGDVCDPQEQTERVCCRSNCKVSSSHKPRSPFGGAAAAAAEGLQMESREKIVSEAARFFPVRLPLWGLKGASSPFLVGPARRNRWLFSGSLLQPKENIPRRRCILQKA